jgi:hypothetical protein
MRKNALSCLPALFALTLAGLPVPSQEGVRQALPYAGTAAGAGFGLDKGASAG